MHSKISNILRKPYKKSRIPKALREQVWLKQMGPTFQGKCNVTWCTNSMTVFDFQCGHNIPESKGGKTNMTNLLPICSRCNLSMGDSYSITEWNNKFAQEEIPQIPWYRKFWCKNNRK